MAPSPSKKPSQRTPVKNAATPTKATRSSPRKRAWGSPPKSAANQLVSNIFKEDDFSPLNKSWAEITEEDESCTDSLLSSCDSARKSKSESRRKNAAPKKVFETKPKFVRSLELSSVLFQGTRSSTRLKDKGEKVQIVEKRIEVVEMVEQRREAPNRKRQLSTTSTVDENVSPAKRRTPHKHAAEYDSGKPARKTARGQTENGKSPARVRLFDSLSSSVSGSPSSRKDNWEAPTLGWCTDDAVLKRRTREIERAKEKSVYQKFATEIPLKKRIKGIHPRTPNKLINYSRRSWDTQMRQWKRSLYTFAGEEPSDSVNTSFCSSGDEHVDGNGDEAKNLENVPVFANMDIAVRPEADAMASLLGRFDIETRHAFADESTLKGLAPAVGPKAAVDFSALHKA